LDAHWTPLGDALGVLVTFVVRLLPDRLAAGELVGEVEHVGGGEHGLIQGASDLVGFAQRTGGGSPGPILETCQPTNSSVAGPSSPGAESTEREDPSSTAERLLGES